MSIEIIGPAADEEHWGREEEHGYRAQMGYVLFVGSSTFRMPYFAWRNPKDGVSVRSSYVDRQRGLASNPSGAGIMATAHRVMTP
jgi:hypothetical protein